MRAISSGGSSCQDAWRALESSSSAADDVRETLPLLAGRSPDSLLVLACRLSTGCGNGSTLQWFTADTSVSSAPAWHNMLSVQVLVQVPAHSKCQELCSFARQLLLIPQEGGIRQSFPTNCSLFGYRRQDHGNNPFLLEADRWVFAVRQLWHRRHGGLDPSKSWQGFPTHIVHRTKPDKAHQDISIS